MDIRFWPVIATAATIAGVLLTLQFRSSVPIDGTFPTDELVAREELLKSFLDEQAYLQSRIVTLRNQADDLQNSNENQSQQANLEFLQMLKKITGLSQVTGSGIVVVLDDSPYALRGALQVSEQDLIQASDIRDVVNLLSAADAEAISVNNQRIIATSAISSVGTTILINDVYIAPPFAIQAVGDTDIMAQRLLNRPLLSSLYERQDKNHITFDITAKPGLVIPIYNGDLQIKHLNLVE